MAIADKLTYLDDTKQLIRGGLESVGEYITDDAPFREYVTKLANSQRTLGSNFAGDSYDLLSPVNDLDFEGVYTLTRGSDGAFWNRHGILSAAGMDVKRVNHDPATLNSSADTFDLATLSRWDVVVVNLGSANTYSEGQVVAVSDDADLNNCFYAEIKSIDADALTCHVAHVQGSGSISAWTIIKSEGLLIEEQRTNLLLWSEAFDDAAWSKQFVTISFDAVASPDTAVTGDKLIESTDNGEHFAEQAGLPLTAGDYTFSCFVKAAERTRGQITPVHVGESTSVTRIDFDLDNGTIKAAAGLSIGTSITPLKDGWFLLSVSYTLTGATTSHRSRLIVSDDTGSINYTGDGASGFYVWGAHTEQGSFPTSYIKTEASQVTRSADNCSRTLGSEFNASEGTVFARSIYKGSSMTTIFDLGGTDLRMQVRHDQDSKIRFVVIDSVGSLINSTPFAKTYTPGAPVKVAISYKSSELIVSVDGETSAIEVFRTPWGAMELAVGSRNSTSPSTETGVISVVEARFIPRALSETELEVLTS